MLKLVSDDVTSIEQFMSRYRVSLILLWTSFLNRLSHITPLPKMDHPAALHRLKVGVPATVEHSSEAGPETGKWVAETTQVSPRSPVSDILC
jgi:ESCRT-I complex subunit VPS28